jgi:hypothetical protein
MTDPRRDARLAGALWLVVIAAGVVSVVTQSRLPRAVHLKSLAVAVVLTGIAILL